MTSRNSNSFDALRLTAAFMVLWSHHFVFVGATETKTLLGFSPSAIGVNIFFAISGYLNAKSAIGGTSCWRFLVRRARRIFPALFAFAIFCVVLGSLVTETPHEFWGPTPDFVYRNTTMLFGIRYSLPGVFDANTFPNVVNGSLWTLPNEIKLYIYLAILAAISRYRALALLVILTIALFTFFAAEAVLTDQTGQFNKLAILFVTGALFALIEKLWNFRTSFVVLVAVSAVYCATAGLAALLPGMACLAILIGSVPAPRILRPPVDISYGIYLYAFPIQQFVSTFSQDFWPTLIASACLTIIAAILSALFVEQPAIRSYAMPTLRPRPFET